MKFDIDKRVLTVGHFVDEDTTTPVDSYVYEQYNDYLNGPIEQDIEYLVSAMKRETVNTLGGEFNTLLVFDRVLVKTGETGMIHIDVEFVESDSVKKDRSYKPLTVLKLPYCRRDGSLVRVESGGVKKEYGYVPYIYNKSGIYHYRKSEERDNMKGLKLVGTGGRMLDISCSASKINLPTISHNKKNVNILNAICYFLSSSGLDPYAELIGRMENYSFINQFEYVKDNNDYKINNRAVGLKVTYAESDADAVNFVNYQTGDNRIQFDLEARKFLNDVLSLKRARGYTLAKDVETSEGVVLAKRGSYVTDSLIDTLEKNRINTIFIKDIINVTGNVLATDIMLYGIAKGSKVLPEIAPVLGEYSNFMYVPEDLFVGKDGYFQHPIIIPKDTVINKDLLEFLDYNLVTSIFIKERVSSTKARKLNLFTEVVSNNQYRTSKDGEPYSCVYVKGDEEIVNESSLTPHDLIAALSLLLRIKDGKDIDVVQDLDISFAKKFKTIGEAISETIRSSADEFSKKHRLAIASNITKVGALKTDRGRAENLMYAFQKIWWNKFAREKKYLDMAEHLNPLLYLYKLRQIKSFVNDAQAVPDSIRYMALGEFGRVCPYETPQSNKTGLVNSACLGMKIDKDGTPRARYYKVRNDGGRIWVDKSKYVYLSNEEELEYIVTTIDEICPNGTDEPINPNRRVIARIPNPEFGKLEKMTIASIESHLVDYCTISPVDILSITTSTLVCIGADDSVRIAFDTSMMKQARALLNPDKPLVFTDMAENIFRYTDKYCIKARDNGEVISIESGIIILQLDSGEIQTINYEPFNSYTDGIIIQTPIPGLKEFDRVYKGQVIITSNYDVDGVYANGKNALVAFIPRGVNYEDGVDVCKKFATSATSFRINKQKDYPPKDATAVAMKKGDGIRYFLEGDKITDISFKANGKTNKKAVKAEHDLGFFISSEKTKSSAFDDSKYEFRSKGVSVDSLIGGDKLANRHGNKGVAPAYRDNTEALSLMNGEIIDVCYNPHGVVSRMNTGQTDEANLSLACKVLGIHVKTTSSGGITVQQIARLMSYAYRMANEDRVEEVCKEFREFPDSLHEYVLNRINDVKNWKGCFNENGTATLYDPRTGRLIENVLIGYNYITKLKHDSATKLHQRGYFMTSDYSLKRASATSGAANGGGQTLGNMELDALGAYGAVEYIQELLHERGDNPYERVRFTVEHLHEGLGCLPKRAASMRRSTLMYLMYMMGLNIQVDIDGLPSIDDLCQELMDLPTKKQLLMARDEDIQQYDDEEIDASGTEDKLKHFDLPDLLDFKGEF